LEVNTNGKWRSGSTLDVKKNGKRSTAAKANWSNRIQIYNHIHHLMEDENCEEKDAIAKTQQIMDECLDSKNGRKDMGWVRKRLKDELKKYNGATILYGRENC
jgi:hypothetical protein